MLRHIFLLRSKGALAVATFFAVALASIVSSTPGHAKAICAEPAPARIAPPA